MASSAESPDTPLAWLADSVCPSLERNSFPYRAPPRKEPRRHARQLVRKEACVPAPLLVHFCRPRKWQGSAHRCSHTRPRPHAARRRRHSGGVVVEDHRSLMGARRGTHGRSSLSLRPLLRGASLPRLSQLASTLRLPTRRRTTTRRRAGAPPASPGAHRGGATTAVVPGGRFTDVRPHIAACSCASGPAWRAWRMRSCSWRWRCLCLRWTPLSRGGRT